MSAPGSARFAMHRARWLALVLVFGTGCSSSASLPSDAGTDVDAFATNGPIDAAIDASPDADVCHPPDATVPAMRLVAPLNTARTTSLRPTFRWSTTTSGPFTLEVCADPACASVLASIDTIDTRAAPTADLPSGTVYFRVSTGSSPRVTSDTWRVRIPRVGAATDTSWGSVLDLDADGSVDLAVSANRGNVFVYMNGATGLPDRPSTTLIAGGAPSGAFDLDGDGFADLVTSPATVYLGGPSGISVERSYHLAVASAGPGLAIPVTSVGDIDADGYGDIVASPWGSSLELDLFYGGPSGPPCAPQRVMTIASQPTHHVRGVGDLDADGYADVVIVSGPDEMYDYGVFVLYGGSRELGRSMTLVAPQRSTGFGQSIAGAGDLNGDGYADLVVSAPGGRSPSAAGLYGNGIAYVYYGSAGGVPARPSATIFAPDQADGTPVSFGDRIGIVGDLNGDGYDELAVNEPGTTGVHGGVYLYPGSSTGVPLAPPIALRRELGGYQFGFAAVLSAADIDGDGIDDLVIGAPQDPPVGNVLVYRGSVSGVATSPFLLLTCPDTEYSFGEALACSE